jgi:uncharacterized membrane protein
MGKKLRRYFLTGIVILAPLGVTLWLLYLIARFVVRMIHIGLLPTNLFDFLPLPGWASVLTGMGLQTANFLIGLLFSLSLILGVGALVNTYVGKRLMRFGESLIERIPFIRSVYSAAKQLTESIFTNKTGKSLNHVVLVEYPRKGIYCLGFVTGQTTGNLGAMFGDKKMKNVFIPSTPNPTTGYYLVLPEEDIREVDLSSEDAFRLIISGGLASTSDKEKRAGERIE